MGRAGLGTQSAMREGRGADRTVRGREGEEGEGQARPWTPPALWPAFLPPSICSPRQGMEPVGPLAS